jgi:hypothetical protein
MTNLHDVHEFDGKWKETITNRFSPDDKRKILLTLKPFIKSNGLDLIIEGIQTASNYENLSGLYADDILVEILEKTKKLKREDRLKFFGMIDEQLTDMYNLGRCPSGRVTRLIQLYKSLNTTLISFE